MQYSTILALPSSLVAERSLRRTHSAWFSFDQNRLNSYSPSTAIRHRPSRQSQDERRLAERDGILEVRHALLKAFDLLGREAATIVHRLQQPRMYEARWCAKDAAGNVIPSGISICALRAGGVTGTRSRGELRFERKIPILRTDREAGFSF